MNEVNKLKDEEVAAGRNVIKKILKKIFAVITILVLIFSPYLLVVDWKTYLPFVVTVWIISAAYYMFVIARRNREGDE